MPDGFGNSGYTERYSYDDSDLKSRVNNLEVAFVVYLRRRGHSVHEIYELTGMNYRHVADLVKADDNRRREE